MAIGVSFVPAAGKDSRQVDAQDSAVQQAIQVLSLRLPRVVGAQGLAPSTLLNAAGGAALTGAGGNVDRIVDQIINRIMPEGAQPGPVPTVPTPRVVPGGQPGQPGQPPTPGVPMPPRMPGMPAPMPGQVPDPQPAGPPGAQPVPAPRVVPGIQPPVVPPPVEAPPEPMPRPGELPGPAPRRGPGRDAQLMSLLGFRQG